MTLKETALNQLRRMFHELPALSPEARADDPLCMAYTDAALLCVEGRYADAIAVMANARRRSA